MSAADEIANAIEKLEYLRARATGGPWLHTDATTTERGFTSNVTSWAFDVANCPGGEQEPVGIEREKRADADAELIVTLHATIDAQLVVLEWARFAYADHGPWHERRANELEEAGLALARAINGGNE